ncbi:metallophosphoesterase [Aeropyrum camini]|uniref:Predicted ICC-like phosphoesterase n=1 Tax=Aeropyrum camini SY1 = JCM 12091 TaxID=1198449 RepID=U3TDZ6_9CREN|nr:metallophosphoesterase [Aeropyrum camini]BAN90636.1 predicted ICC-like phosphoesterase [Aeropyrum camini SY1 = JCM 12091]
MAGSMVKLVPLEEAKGLFIVEGSPILYHKPSSTILFSDLHLGYEQAMTETGVFLPRVQLRRAMLTLDRAISGLRPRRAVIVGDVKHVFDRLLKQEALETAKLLEWLSSRGVEKIIVVRGNHDNYIQGVVTKSGGEFVEDYFEVEKGVVAIHGHKKLEFNSDIIIIGHEHPAVKINVAGSRVKYPAFLMVPRECGGSIIVLPALGVYQTGNPITLDRSLYLSPYIREEGIVEEAVPIIIDESVGSLRLPPLRELAKIFD